MAVLAARQRRARSSPSDPCWTLVMVRRWSTLPDMLTPHLVRLSSAVKPKGGSLLRVADGHKGGGSMIGSGRNPCMKLTTRTLAGVIISLRRRHGTARASPPRTPGKPSIRSTSRAIMSMLCHTSFETSPRLFVEFLVCPHWHRSQRGLRGGMYTITDTSWSIPPSL
jgi:hypothetical protein